MRTQKLLILVCVLVLTTGAAVAPSSSVVTAAPTPAARAGGPLFIANAGQWPEAARFQAWGGGSTLWLAEDALWITVMGEPDAHRAGGVGDRESGRIGEWEILTRSPTRPLTPSPQLGVNIKLSFPGANPHPRLEPFERLDTHVSYFLGGDPAGWRPDVPVWGGVRYVELYPGIDLELAGVGGRLAPRLAARPGADLTAVRLRVEGADAVAVHGNSLRLSTAAGEVALPLLAAGGSPVERAQVERVDAEGANVRTFEVAAPFAAAHSNRQWAIANPQSPADNPADLLYSTFLGGSDDDYGSGIAVDASGNAYVAGSTYSSSFPTTPGAFNTSFHGGWSDAFVVKLDPTSNRLVYATFLGGSGGDGASIGDGGSAVAVDEAGNAFVTGFTWSSDFPTTPGAFDTSFNGGVCFTLPCTDVFVAKLNPAGTSLVYATFLGGSDRDSGTAIAVDAAGSAYVTGETRSNDFPTTPGALDASYNGDEEVYVAKLNPAGSGLAYATFVGATESYEGVGAIAVDGMGSAYVTGWTNSSDFPATLGAFDTSYNGANDVFVVKLDPAGSTLVYATFLGGGGTERGYGIAVDAAGSVHVTGGTGSIDFPVTPDAFDTSRNSVADAFVVKLNPAGSNLTYATFLGGSEDDRGDAIAVDRGGRVYVTGVTSSSNFPTTSGAFDTSYNGPSGFYDGDAFMVKLNPAGSTLAYATFLGGSGGDDIPYGIAVDEAGSVCVTGYTASGDFPTTSGAFDRSYNGEDDAFVVKLLAGPPPLPPTISGAIWYDLDGDAARDGGEPGLVGIVVELFRYGLQMGQTTTSGDGTYRFASLLPGEYIVREVQPGWLRFSSTPDEVVVFVATGQELHVDFGDWNGRPIWLPLILR